jgi:hypothetical protein
MLSLEMEGGAFILLLNTDRKMFVYILDNENLFGIWICSKRQKETSSFTPYIPNKYLLSM